MIFHWMAKNNTKCVCGGADAGKEWLVVIDKVIRHVTKCYKEKKRDTALNRRRACVRTQKKKLCQFITWNLCVRGTALAD